MADDAPENRREAFAYNLACGHSVRHAALSASIPETTGRRWLNDSKGAESLHARVKELRNEMTSQLVGVYIQLGLKGAARLAKLLESADDELALRAVRRVNADLLALMERCDFRAEMAAMRDELERRTSQGTGATPPSGPDASGG